MFTLHDITSLAIHLERNGEAVYRTVLERVTAKEVRDLFLWLAEQEVGHRQWFMALQQQHAKTGNDYLIDEASAEILSTVLGAQTFSLEDTLSSDTLTVEDLRRIALEFERDTILFYELIWEWIEDAEIRTHLEVIISEEKQHAKVLEERATELI